MEDKVANVTIAVDAALLRRARVKALEEGTSLNAVLRKRIEEYVVHASPAAAATRQRSERTGGPGIPPRLRSLAKLRESRAPRTHQGDFRRAQLLPKNTSTDAYPRTRARVIRWQTALESLTLRRTRGAETREN